MLLEAAGVPLVVHSARNVIASGSFARVVVATDDGEIIAACRRLGVEARLTRADHQSGSDRVNECLAALLVEGERAEVVVNVQGDEPDLARADFAALVAAFDDPAVELATLSVPLVDPAQFENPKRAVLLARPDSVARPSRRGRPRRRATPCRRLRLHSGGPGAVLRTAARSTGTGREPRAIALARARLRSAGGDGIARHRVDRYSRRF
jgi:3-deoxy-manno-octulosonate cytidylyltransferase (CMP-KDO synthetase)